MKTLIFTLTGLVGFFLTSCGEKTVTPAAPQGEHAAASDAKLTLYTWIDYADPEVFHQFSERTGIEVEVLFYDSTEEMLAAVQSEPDRYDVVIADDITVSHLKKLALIRELDRSKLPHFGNIDPKFGNLPFDEGNAYSIPYMWGSTLVAYRKDKIPNLEKSWSIFWNPEYRGRVMMLDGAEDIFQVTLHAANRDVDASDSEDIDFAKEKVLEQIREVDVQFAGYTEVLEKLVSGEIWIGMNYSGDVAMAVEENPEIDFFIPKKEGALLWLDNLVISRDSKHVDAAHKFIDFMMEAEVAAANSNFVLYASPNKAAEPYLDEELLSDERLYPTPEVMAKCQFPTPEIQAKREHLLNLAMRDIRKLRREKDAEAIAESEVVEVGESIQ